jgi:hypothetical protein
VRAAFALLVVVALGALGWWILRPAGTPRAAGPYVGETDAEPAVGPASAEKPATPTLPARTVVAKKQEPKAPSSPAAGKGDLVVVLVPPEGGAVPLDAKIDLEPLGRKFSAYPLALRQEDGSWRYTAIPAGRYRVWVLSPGWRDASAEATVTNDAEARASIPLAPGASAKFRVVTWVGEAPANFSVSVFDGRRLPVAASFQVSATRVRVPAGSSIGGATEGTLIGLKPGTYTLRATGEGGEIDEATFEAKVGGEPTEVELKLKR